MFKSNIFSITIVNNTTQAQPWVAFGYNQGTQNVPGVIVSVSESSLEQSTKQSASIPFKIKSIKVKTQNSNQLSNPITIAVIDATGKRFQSVLTPMDYYEPDTKIPNLIKVISPNIIIDSRTSLSGVINANQTMNITIELQNTSKFSNFITGIFKNFKSKTVEISWRPLPI